MKYKTKLNMKKTTARFVSASIILSTSLTNLSIVSAEDSIQMVDNTSGSAIVITNKTNQDIQPLIAEPFVDSDFVHTNVTGGKRIDSLSTAGSNKLIANNYELVLPDTINGLPVVSINDNAFSGKRLTSVNIPNGVTSIGNYAFSSNRLTSVNIPDSVKTIGASAFSTNGLTSVNIPNGVTTIGVSAFSSNRLTSVNIPDSVTAIGASAFYDNKLISANIPNGITTIENSTFNYNQLTSIVIPSSVKTIGSNAFSVNQLTSIDIPTSVTSIGYGAFNNNKLTSATIPNTVTSMYGYAFANNQLTNINIPNTLLVISSGAFKNNLLTSVVIPDSVILIESGAFASNKLTSVVIPNNVTSLGEEAFFANDLISVKLSNKLTTIGNYAFYSNDIKSIEIPTSVTSIGYYTFAGNQLTEVIIPNNVKTLGQGAFAENYLKYIKFSDISTTTVDVIKTIWGSRAGDENQLHGILSWSMSLPHAVSNYVDYNNYVVKKQVSQEFYLRYPIKIAYNLEEGSTLNSSFATELITDVSESGWTDFSFLTPEDLEDRLNQLDITNSKGFSVVGWEIVNKKGIDTLEIDNQTYIMSDVEVKPIYDTIAFDVTQSEQLDLLTSKTDSSIYFEDTKKGSITPNEVFDFSLTDGYIFYLNDNESLLVNFENSSNTASLVKTTTFADNVNYWQYMLNEDKTKISVKAPNSIEKIDIEKPVGLKIDNLGIKDADGIFGTRDTKIVEVFLNKKNAIVDQGVIATLEFKKSIEAQVVQPTEVFGRKTDSSGSIKVISNVRYSINDNELFEIKLDDGFRFINNTPDIDDPETQGDYINITNTGKVVGEDVAIVYVPDLADFDDDSTDWQYTYSENFSTIYISTPVGLHGEIDNNGIIKNLATVNLERGITFNISNLGVSALDSTEITGEKDVNYTVTNNADFTQTDLFATLLEEVDGGDGDGGDGDGGDGNGGDGNGGDGNGGDGDGGDGDGGDGNGGDGNGGDGDGGDGNGGDGDGGGGSGGGGGGHKPNKNKPTVEPEKPEEIETLIDPYIFGYTDGSVRPNGNITRAEVAQVVYNLYGDSKAVNKAILNNYSDINTNAWYSDAVAYATQAGVFEGYNDKTFKPNTPISREEVSAIIDRLYFDEIVSYGNLDIKLSDIQNSWAKEDIEYLVSKGIITGYPDGTFKPKQSIERDEFVVMMNKLTDRPKEYEVKTTFYDLSPNEWNYEDMMNASNYAIEK